MTKKKWSSKWPTTKGHYWVFGWPWGNTGLMKDTKPEWNFIELRGISNGTIAVRNGQFWFESDQCVGKFLPIEFPDEPNLSE